MIVNRGDGMPIRSEAQVLDGLNNCSNQMCMGEACSYFEFGINRCMELLHRDAYELIRNKSTPAESTNKSEEGAIDA